MMMKPWWLKLLCAARMLSLLLIASPARATICGLRNPAGPVTARRQLAGIAVRLHQGRGSV
jgi:hypothetical protein